MDLPPGTISFQKNRFKTLPPSFLAFSALRTDSSSVSSRNRAPVGRKGTNLYTVAFNSGPDDVTKETILQEPCNNGRGDVTDDRYCWLSQ